MKAVILAAGKGLRLRPLTALIPKCLLPVGNKTLLEHTVKNAKLAGIKEFVIVVGYRKEEIQEFFAKKKFGVKIEYAEQLMQRGTANALLQAEEFLDNEFLVLSPDSLINSKVLKRLVKAEPITMIVKELNSAKELGIVRVRAGKVSQILEKKDISSKVLVNTGTYLLDKRIFEAIRRTTLSERNEYELTEALNILLSMGTEIKTQLLREDWLDIATPMDLLRANELFLKSLKKAQNGRIEKFATLKGPVSIGKGSIIRNGSYLLGPISIGENCEIGPNCYIRPYTTIGNKVRIGNGVEIKNSIIMDSTHIGHLSYVGDSIIGRNCNFGAGTIVANLRFDKKTIPIVLDYRRIDSQLEKLGVIMGDNVKTGINVSINVGTVIGENAKILPHTYVSGYIEANSIIS